MRESSIDRTSFVLVFLLILGVNFSSLGQSKDELQRKRDEISKQIQYTEKLIDEARKNQKSTENDLLVLDQQIRLRKKLIDNFNDEILSIDDEIEDNKANISSLQSELDKLKAEYGRMVYEAYKNRSAYDKLMFIFASNDFNQAYKRMKIIQQYASARKTQAETITNTQTELSSAIQSLENSKLEKKEVADQKAEEFNRLESDKSSRKDALTSLKQQESKLKKKRDQQEQERQKLNNAIQRIIEEELKASRAANNGKFALTPEGEIVSSNFEKNKGKLPWPVVRGVVTTQFGKQAHPFLPGITIENKGIDISTDNNSQVLAVFGGEVSKVFSITGAGMNVIINHGAYRTVFANLKEVSVKAGDHVDARQSIGTALSDSEKTEAHLEIWKITDSGGTALNPLSWLIPK